MIKAKKSLSQNFIIDKNICKKIILETKVKNETILEIGPGYGFLTDIILRNDPKKLILIEKDTNLVKFLKKKYYSNNKILIIEKDILKFDLRNYKNLLIISNLPYNISTKIILYLFKFNKNIKEMVFMVQKEVAQKFDYNLSNMNKYKFITNIVCTFTRCFDVSPKVFYPKPKVKSTVVRFKFNKKDFDFNKAISFSNKIFKNVRKKIYNNIKFRSNNELLNKRVNELDIKDLISIYNIF